MAAKKSGCLGAATSLVFTSVVGPILVQVGTNAFKSEDGPRPCPATTTTSWSSPHVPPIPDVEVQVIAQGVGATPESAWDDAVSNGVRTAILSQMDAQSCAQNATNSCAAVPHDTRSLITRCVDLGCLGRPGVWRREVAVFVDRAALIEKLRSTLVHGRAVAS